MPYYDPPDSDLTRLAMLRQAVERITQEGEKTIIDASLVNQLKELLAQFEGAYQLLQAQQEKSKREVEEGEKALSQLKLYIRHTWTTVQNRIIRQQLPASVHGYYGLPLSGDVPTIDTRQKWLEMAQNIIAGDTRAVKDGFAPMAEPTAVELQAILDKAQKETNEVIAARADVKTGLEGVQALRPTVDAALKELVDVIRFHYRNQEPATVRDHIRFYGGNFRLLEGEPPEDTTA